MLLTSLVPGTVVRNSRGTEPLEVTRKPRYIPGGYVVRVKTLTKQGSLAPGYSYEEVVENLVPVDARLESKAKQAVVVTKAAQDLLGAGRVDIDDLITGQFFTIRQRVHNRLDDRQAVAKLVNKWRSK